MQLMHTPQDCREEHVGEAHPKNIYTIEVPDRFGFLTFLF